MLKNIDPWHRPEWFWRGRSLENYKRMHPKAAGAKTLTQARKLAFGNKTKRFTCCRGGCAQCNGKMAA